METETHTYKRVLGLKDLIFLGLSMTIGSGIFVLIGNATKHSGSLTWLAMLVAGFLGLTTAFSYGELSGMLQSNTAEYGFIQTATNKSIADASGFLILVSDLFILATVALGLGSYLSTFLPMGAVPLSVLSIIAVNVCNYYGIELSTQISRYALLIKILALVTIIYLSSQQPSKQSSFFDIKNVTQQSFFTGAILNLFAYLGFNNLVNFNEETINPGVNIGNSIIITLVIVTILYTLLSVSAMRTMGSGALGKSEFPLADMSSLLIGDYGHHFFMILAVVSLLDTLLVTSVSESRYIHALLSKVSNFFKTNDIHPTYKTPCWSIAVLALATIVIVCGLGNIESTGIYGDLIVMIIFTVVNAIAILLRYTQPEVPRPFKIPFNVGQLPIPAVLGIGVSLYSVYQYFVHCA